jgi:hypothetical protein
MEEKDDDTNVHDNGDKLERQCLEEDGSTEDEESESSEELEEEDDAVTTKSGASTKKKKATTVTKGASGRDAIGVEESDRCQSKGGHKEEHRKHSSCYQTQRGSRSKRRGSRSKRNMRW